MNSRFYLTVTYPDFDDSAKHGDYHTVITKAVHAALSSYGWSHGRSHLRFEFESADEACVAVRAVLGIGLDGVTAHVGREVAPEIN